MTEIFSRAQTSASFSGILKINGRTIPDRQIPSFALGLSESARHEWEKALGRFLLQWVSDAPRIEVRTSGSTGQPTVIQLTRQAMRASAMATGTFFGFGTGMTALLCLSAEYIAGMMMVVRAMVYGMDLIPLPPVNSPLEHLYVNHPVDFAAMVPAQVHASLMDVATRDKLLGIKTLLLGGAPVSPALEKSIAGFHPNAWCGFGMTETITHVALRKIQPGADPGVYTPLPGVGVTLGRRGNLVFHTPYTDAPAETRDAGTLLPDGRFRWLGREDFVINSGGIKIYPEQLEAKIATFFPHPFFISSRIDEARGEAVVMVVEHGHMPARSETSQWNALLRNNLIRKYLPAEIRVAPSFRYTATGKVDRMASLAESRLVEL